MRSRRIFLAACAGSALSLRAETAPEITFIKTPENGVQPQAVVDRNGVLHLVYLYGDAPAADIAYVRQKSSDRTFTAPVRVNDRPGSAVALGTVRGAHLALGKQGRLHVAWNGSTSATPKGPLNSAPILYARLRDNGTFEPQRNLTQVAGGIDGGGALAADPFGNVYVSWHAPGLKDGKRVDGEGSRRVWLARSSDGGDTFSRETAVSPSDLGACGCCGMGALADRRGNLYLLYRSARELVHRDMYLLISRDKGATFRTVAVQPWEIGACPMSTVALTEANGNVFVSWETQKQVYFARVNMESGSIGHPVSPPGEGVNRKHPSIAVSRKGDVLLSWTEGTAWKKGGYAHYQLFDSADHPITSASTNAAVPVWGSVAAAATDRLTVIC